MKVLPFPSTELNTTLIQGLAWWFYCLCIHFQEYHGCEHLPNLPNLPKRLQYTQTLFKEIEPYDLGHQGYVRE